MRGSFGRWIFVAETGGAWSCGATAAVKKVQSCTWLEKELLEATWAMEVERMGPFIVTMDSSGDSRYDTVRDEATRRITEIYK